MSVPPSFIDRLQAKESEFMAKVMSMEVSTLTIMISM